MPTHDEQITALLETFEAQQANMEPVAQRFLAATEAMLVALWPKLVRTAVTETFPDRAKELGPEALGSLKVELENLIAHAPDVVREDVENLPAWSHRVTAADVANSNFSYDHWGQPPAPIADAIRRAAGRVGPLLIERGLVGPRTHGREWPFVVKASGTELASNAAQWTQEMREAIARYSEMHDELERLVAELAEVRKSKTESEAANLWDAA